MFLQAQKNGLKSRSYIISPLRGLHKQKLLLQRAKTAFKHLNFNIMKASNTPVIYKLSQRGIILFLGTENECFLRLQSIQSSSADWAIKYEGYTVSEFEQAEQFTKYVLDSINLDDYELENTPTNLLSVAGSEKPNGYNKKSRFIDWLKGEPSTFVSTTVYNENVALFIKLGIETPNSATYTTEMEMLQGMIFDLLTFLSK